MALQGLQRWRVLRIVSDRSRLSASEHAFSGRESVCAVFRRESSVGKVVHIRKRFLFFFIVCVLLLLLCAVGLMDLWDGRGTVDALVETRGLSSRWPCFRVGGRRRFLPGCVAVCQCFPVV